MYPKSSLCLVTLQNIVNQQDDPHTEQCTSNLDEVDDEYDDYKDNNDNDDEDNKNIAFSPYSFLDFFLYLCYYSHTVID